jgi:hypothetical protein
MKTSVRVASVPAEIQTEQPVWFLYCSVHTSSRAGKRRCSSWAQYNKLKASEWLGASYMSMC